MRKLNILLGQVSSVLAFTKCKFAESAAFRDFIRGTKDTSLEVWFDFFRFRSYPDLEETFSSQFKVTIL